MYACTVKEGPENLDYFNLQMYTTAESQVGSLNLIAACTSDWLLCRRAANTGYFLGDCTDHYFEASYVTAAIQLDLPEFE